MRQVRSVVSKTKQDDKLDNIDASNCATEGLATGFHLGSRGRGLFETVRVISFEVRRVG